MRSGSLPSTTKTKSGRSSAARGAAAPAEWRSCRWRRSARRTVLDDHHKTENAGSGLFRPTSTPRTKLVFSGLTGELETIPDCGSIWRCVQAATSLVRSEEHTSELQSHLNLVCRLLLEKKKNYSHCVAHTAIE